MNSLANARFTFRTLVSRVINAERNKQCILLYQRHVQGNYYEIYLTLLSLNLISPLAMNL